LRNLVMTALVVLVLQIALGGWVSSNYAALACPDFPACQGQLWPDTNFNEGFVLWREIGVDFEGGVLDLPSRTAIHMAHRIGAVVTLAVLLFTALRLARHSTLQRAGVLLMGLVSLQFLLGILNIVMQLPLANAVAHNGVAALLLVVLTGLLYRTSPGRT
jgi:cytochrome c oxidase assembly protein subunit 15